MPDFFHRRMIVTYAPCIERHRLLLLFERFFLLMTMKLHKVAQLRRIELTSSGNSRLTVRNQVCSSSEDGNQSLAVFCVRLALVRQQKHHIFICSSSK